MTLKYLLFPFVCSLLACLALARLAPWLSLMDRPDARKQHGREVPVVGGIAILISYVLALKLRGIAGNMVDAMLPVGLMLTVGLIDDARPMPARFKLLCQIAAAWMLVRTTGFVVQGIPLPGVPGGIALGELAMPFTVLTFVAVTNAINMSDGADGLAGGHVVVALVFFALIAVATGQAVTLLLIAGLISAVLGFLACNARHPLMPQARVFLGDAGALSLGVLLCWIGLTLVRGSQGTVPAIMILFAVALPVLDMFTVSIRRALRGTSPFTADRTHLHHLLCLRGMSIELSVPLLWALNVGMAGLGLLLWRRGVTPAAMTGVFFALLLAKIVCLRVWSVSSARSDG
ncbi:MraY family glycosyltransferase [Uliginosibacterium sp. sgz301328]|uniref:MraY family glycosyltransferase n=1 Tax=Uliginosibacterium sp. sgz301328 TaxID=3243764 RepID=UPI00359EA85D